METMRKAVGRAFWRAFQQSQQEAIAFRSFASALPIVESPTHTSVAQTLVKVGVPLPLQDSKAEDVTTSTDFQVLDASLQRPRLLSPKKQNLDLTTAIQHLQTESKRKFDETIDVVFRLGTDPRRGDQQVRGAVNLPHGTGKQTKVCVFTDSETGDIARAAGADMIGNEETIADIKAGKINFDKCLATANMMPKLSAVARVLGPRGLMPNPKLGTLVDSSSIPGAVKQMKAGRVEFRADKTANVHVGIGKVSFPTEHIQRNFGVLANALLNARPKGVKGSGANGYILGMSLSSTMGRGIPITMSSLLTAVQRGKAAS